MLTVLAFLMALMYKDAKFVLQWLRDEEYDVDKEQKEVADLELQEKGRIFCKKIIRVQYSNPIWLFLQDFV